MKITPRALWSLLAIAAMFVAQAVGYTVSAEEVTAGGIMLAGMGDMEDITKLLEKQGRTFEEFKTANDTRLKAIEEKGYAPADTVEKVDKINADLNTLSAEIQELMKKSNRPNMSGSDENALTEEQQEHKAAFRAFLRKGNPGDLSDLEKKVFQRGSDVDGGYLIDDEMDTFIDRVAAKVSVMRNLADVKSIGKESLSMRVKTSGTAANWVGEGETASDATKKATGAKWAKIEITAEEMEIEPWFYNSAMDDADFDLFSDIVSEAGIGFGEGEGAAFISGDGVKKPRGILGYSAVANSSYAWGKVGYIASGAAGAFAASNPGDQIITLQHSLKAAYRNGAVMLMNDSTLAKVRQMKDGSGNFYLFNPDATGKFPGFVLGTPVEIDDNMPDIAADSLSIAYANFQRAYRIVDRTGIALIRDNITEKGTTKFNFRKRVGGGIKHFEAIKLLKMAAN